MSRIIDGEVELKLGADTLMLRPTLNAATRIARHFGGFSKAHQKIQDLDIDAYVHVIRWGAGLDDSAAKGLPEKVFKAGLLEIIGPVSDYVVLLSNGGRPIEAQSTDDMEKAPGNAS